MTQRAIVLDRLRQAGTLGVHTFDLRSAYIGNPSERIRELIAEGCEIRCVRERRSPDRAMGARYFLVSEPEQAWAVDDDAEATGVPIRPTSASPDQHQPAPAESPSPSEPDRAAGVDTRIGSPSSQAVAPPGASPLGARELLPPAEAGLFDSTEFTTRRGSYKDAA